MVLKTWNYLGGRWSGQVAEEDEKFCNFCLKVCRGFRLVAHSLTHLFLEKIERGSSRIPLSFNYFH